MAQRVPFQRIGVEEARTLLASGGALVLDVRNPDAFQRAQSTTRATSLWPIYRT